MRFAGRAQGVRGTPVQTSARRGNVGKFDDHPIIRNIVGRLHVGATDDEVRDAVAAKLNPKLHKTTVLAVMRSALRVHHKNQALYQAVVGGTLGAKKRRKNPRTELGHHLTDRQVQEWAAEALLNEEGLHSPPGQIPVWKAVDIVNKYGYGFGTTYTDDDWAHRENPRRKNPGLAILNPLPDHLQTFAQEQQLRGPELEEFNKAIARYCEFHGVDPKNITIEQIGETEGDEAKFLVGMGATEDVSYSANHKGIYKHSNKRGVPFRHEFPSRPHMATTPDGDMIVIVNRSGNGKRFAVSDWIRG